VGADEFAVLLENDSADRAGAVAAEMLRALRTGYLLGDTETHLSASVGILSAEAPATASVALRNASLALDAAKRAGRNKIVVFEPSLRTARLDHSRLTSGLRRAVAQNEFSLVYQPVIELHSGKITAVETLLRWYPPGEELVPCLDFIPVAEETGLIVPIGAWVLRQASAQARRWHDEYGVAVTVNVSGHQLRDPRFPTTVFDALYASGLPGKALILEITESVLIAENAAEATALQARLKLIRDQGVRLAIDDFGTGYSSLSYLRHLPVDILKIDKAFIGPDSGTEHARGDQAFIRAILELAGSLQLQTIAEGVETMDQARLLRTMECEMGQGYLYHRPLSPTAVDILLANAPQPAPAGAP
jgi:diguanylate cyclase